MCVRIQKLTNLFSVVETGLICVNIIPLKYTLEGLCTTHNLGILFVSFSFSPKVCLVMPKAYVLCVYVYAYITHIQCCVNVCVLVLPLVCPFCLTFYKIFILGGKKISRHFCCSSMCWLVQHYPIKNNITQFSSLTMCL